MSRVVPLALTVALLALTAMAVLAADSANRERAATARERAADDAVAAIDRRMAAYAEVLHGLVGLFESSDDVTSGELARYLAGRRVRERHPGVRALGFARSRDHRLVVTRVAPARGNESALGFDLRGEPRRRAAAERAISTNEPAATAPIALVQDGATGFGLVLPVRRDGALQGVGFASFRTSDLVAAALLGQAPADVALRDGALSVYGRPVEDPVTRRLRVAGRTWTLEHRSLMPALSAADRATPFAAAGLGSLLALLAGGLVHLLMTARRRAEAAAATMTRELQDSKADLEHFSYLASHDLQEPLRTVTSFTGVLAKRLDDRLDERERQYMGFVADGARRMQSLIEDLLEYSRTGRRLEPEVLDLGEAWDAAVGSLAGAITEHGASVTRSALPVVDADRRDMVSVMQNLVSNALKYRREDVAPRVHAEARRVDGRWEVRVSDNGQGIDPRFHDRVFQLFQRLHTAEEAAGTGMGLAIVKKVAKASGGDVRVESTVGAGSTFVVELPAR